MGWMDGNVMEFVDGKSVGAIYELASIPTEGQGEDFIRELRLQFSALIADVFPRYDDTACPWILSLYVSDDVGLEEAMEKMRLYVEPRARDQAFTKVYLNWWHRHCDKLSQAGGLFVDPMTGMAAQGCTRRVRLVIYRNISKKAAFSGAKNPSEELDNICIGLESHFQSSRIVFQRYSEPQFYAWMVRWLSPKPEGYTNVNEYLSKNPVPTEDLKPIGYDLTQAVFSSTPTSNDEDGIWNFDGLLHSYIPILGFKRIPQDGVLTAEKT